MSKPTRERIPSKNFTKIKFFKRKVKKGFTKPTKPTKRSDYVLLEDYEHEEKDKELKQNEIL